MRVRYCNIVFLCLFLILLFDIGFFYLIPLSPVVKTNKFFIMDILAVIAAIITLTKYKETKNITRGFISKYSVVFCISISIIFTYTWHTYPEQKLMDTVLSMEYFLIYFMVYGLILYFSQFGIDVFMNAAHRIVIPWATLLLINSFYYSSTGAQLISYFAEDNISVREGIRISLYSMLHLSLLYDFEILINKRKSPVGKIKCLITLILGIASLIIVEQTRAQILAVCASMAIVAVLNSTQKSTILRRVIIIIAAYYAIVQSGFIDTIIQSLSGSGVEVYGAHDQSHRLSEIAYYLECFMDNPLCGFGFLRYGGAYNQILRGQNLRFFTNDVGIFGLLGNIGIFAFVLYVSLLIRWLVILVKMVKTKYHMRYFLAALYVYNIATSASLIMFSSNTALLYPLSIALFEYCDYDQNRLLFEEAGKANNE